MQNSVITIIKKMQFVNFMSEGSNRFGQHKSGREFHVLTMHLAKE